MAQVTGNPFLDMDFSKIFDFSQFQPQNFSKLAEQYQLPGVDPQSLVEAQRKNFEAFSAANRVALEGVQAVAQRQTEILRETFEEVQKAANVLAASGTPEQRLAKQTELTKEGFEHALANIRELTEMTAKSQSEAAEVLSHRFTESLDEIKTVFEKSTNGK